jgi:hypothetical protein
LTHGINGATLVTNDSAIVLYEFGTVHKGTKAK